MEYDNSFSNTKYCLAQMMHEALETPDGIKLKQTRTMKELWYVTHSIYDINYLLGCLKTRKHPGTSCQIEIHFSSQTSKFLIKCNLLRFQISGGLIIFFSEHDYKVSTSFIEENKTAKWIFIR